MRVLTQSEIEAVAGGSMPQCHASDPAPYSTPRFSLSDYLQFFMML
jgi:hypothetical protein